MQQAICKNRNEELGNGMRGMMGTRGIRVGTRGMGLGMLGMLGNAGNQAGNGGIRMILFENLRVYCFG